MRRSCGFTLSTTASTWSPTLTSFEGCFMRFDQVISLTWTRPSMPCSSSMKRAVVGHADHPAMLTRAPDRITLGGVQPRVGRQLLEAQRHALLLAIELQNFYLDLVADVDQVTRMRQRPQLISVMCSRPSMPPRVDERAVIGQVLHRAGQHRVLLQTGSGS
jgi:hypothetical protein